jgi:hypothetical protein
LKYFYDCVIGHATRIFNSGIGASAFFYASTEYYIFWSLPPLRNDELFLTWRLDPEESLSDWTIIVQSIGTTSLSATAVLKDSQLTPEEQCRIVSERLKGARLYPVGGAKIAGINFSAKTKLDVHECPEGLPDFAHYGDEVYEGKSHEKHAKENTNIPLKRYNFPRPFALSSLPHKDISMQSIENDDLCCRN